MIGGRGEEELLLRAARAVVAGAVQALQRPLKVQQLAHEVKVWRDVGLLALDEVVGVVERQVEPLHQVGHRDGNRTADTRQAVDQDAALLRPGLVW